MRFLSTTFANAPPPPPPILFDQSLTITILMYSGAARLTATLVIRWPRYYDHVFLPEKTAVHFVIKNPR